MLPHIDDVLHMHGGDMSEAGIERMSVDLARRGMMAGDPPRGHNQSTLNDIARLLILQRLLEQGAVPIFPYPPFFFVQPAPIHRLPMRPVPPIHHGRPR